MNVRGGAAIVLVVVLAAAARPDALFRRGDATGDGRVTITDAVKCIRVIFLGDAAVPCADALDADDDGQLGIGDPLFILSYLFAAGPPPPDPFDRCGPDPTADGLSCARYPRCPPGDDGRQESGSIYMIRVPPPDSYNGRLVIWAHGFQDAGTPIEIPDWQMRFGDIYLPDMLTSLGFAFATDSYSKTGLAVLQGVADIRDLVDIFVALHGKPEKVYVVGASEGGLITALLVERFPEVFAGGLAACGPIGDFEYQIDYFGDGRAVFEAFFPGLIPGDPFRPSADLAASWPARYEAAVKPAVLDPANAAKMAELAAAAKLPVDPGDFGATAEVCVRDVLSYCVVDLADAVVTLGGFPFENRSTAYSGTADDDALNRAVPRVGADPAALEEMRARYDTTGRLVRPLVTMHTLLDSQVPFHHEALYAEKCERAGSSDLLQSIPVDRFGHCNFTSDEALNAFATLLQAAGDLGW